MVSMKKIIFICIALLVVLVFLLNFKYTLKFEPIEKVIPNDELNPISSTMKPWFSIRDKKYNPWYDLNYISNIGLSCEEWDMDKYTYIICFGYELKKLSFSPLLLNMKSDFQIEYIGITEFNEEFSNCVYVYRIPKMNIDFNYGEPARYSKFGDYTYEELLNEKYNVNYKTDQSGDGPKPLKK